MGEAQNGHYYSLVSDYEKERQGEPDIWIEFNDELVTPFDPNDIASEAYGGEREYQYFQSAAGVSTIQKIKNAYMLFYERIEHQENEIVVEKKPEENEMMEDGDEVPEGGDGVEGAEGTEETQEAEETQVVEETELEEE